MIDSYNSDEVRRMDFAFTKFWGLKHPIYIERRIFTSEYSGGLHNHDYPQIWYCMDGKYVHQVEDQLYECEKGSVILIPSGVYHKFRILEGEHAELISLSVMYDIFIDVPQELYINTKAVLFLAPFAKELGHSSKRYISLSKKSQEQIEIVLSCLRLTWFEPPMKNAVNEIYDRLEQLFSIPEFAIPPKYYDKVSWLFQSRHLPIARALSCLNVHYYEKIGEEKLLEVSGVCHTELYRHFKRITGYTVSEYHRTLRTRHAIIYLKFTTYPISYISDICGFYDLTHMIRMFKKYVGQTPKALRMARKEWLEKNPDQPSFKYY